MSSERTGEKPSGGFPDAVARFDRAGRLFDVNLAVTQALGMSLEDLRGRTVHDLPLGGRLGHVEAVDEGIRRALAEGRPNRVQASWSAPEGPRIIEISNIPYLDAGGATISVIGIARDITKQAREMRQLALLSFALNQVREAAYLIDENAQILFVNRESCRVLGYTREALRRMSTPDLDPGFPAEEWPRHWSELKERRSLTFETRHRTQDGRIIPVEVNANYFEYGGRGYNLALARDITERKRADRKLAELAAIVEYSEESIIGKNLDGIVTSWNRSAEKLFGYTEQEMAGQSIRVLIPPDRAGELADILERVRAGQSVEHLETVRLRKDGHRIEMALSITPIRDPAGHIIAASTIGRDISGSKRAEAKVQQQLQELQRWHDVTLNREERVLELKQEVNQLLARLGEPARYGGSPP